MRISEVIKRLVKLQKTHGDVRVANNNADYAGNKYYELDIGSVTIEESYTRAGQPYWRDIDQMQGDGNNDEIFEPLVVMGK